MRRGQGLHTGAWGAIGFERREGPVYLRVGDIEIALADLVPLAADRATTVGTPDGRVRIATLEHVLAALGGLGIHEGVTIVAEGPEAPLADGGARAYADDLRLLDIPISPPHLVIVQAGAIDIGTSRYEFSVGEHARLEVEVDFDLTGRGRPATSACWPRAGDNAAQDFLERIAPARTFGFEHEVNDLLARGLASHVTPESVVVIGEDRVLSAGAPFSADEPARHKLLDLIGDLYLHGGPPLGSLRAVRPGHAATHEALRRAQTSGFVSLR